MQLNVPFYVQTTSLNCGLTALKMVLAFCGDDYPIEELEQAVGVQEGKSVSTLQLAIVAASFGFKTAFYSKSLGFNPENLKLDFYQKYVDSNSISSDLVDKARQLGVLLHEQTFGLDELLDYLQDKVGVLVLLDWNIVTNREENGYQGHFVPIVGMDESFVYVHNGGLQEPRSSLAIPREVFERARVAKGTDEDVLFIFPKTN